MTALRMIGLMLIVQTVVYVSLTFHRAVRRDSSKPNGTPRNDTPREPQCDRLQKANRQCGAICLCYLRSSNRLDLPYDHLTNFA